MKSEKIASKLQPDPPHQRKPGYFNRPVLLLAVVIGLLFLSEAAVMLILSQFPAQEPLVEALIDAVLLTCFAVPILYLLLLKPMAHQLHMRRLREHEVQQAQLFDRLKDDFISTAAHELCTPITVVRGYVELLRNTDCSLPEAREGFLDVIYDKTEVLERIVDDMLDMSRSQLGMSLRLCPQRQDLLPLLKQVVASFRLLYPARTIDTDWPVSLPETDYDRVRLEQVFSNLLGNAIKFSPDSSTIRFAASVCAGRIVVEVVDHGIGMDEQTLAKVFDRFYRADSSSTAKGGLGIGLTITRAIVEAHACTIELLSQPGAGTTARVSLPISFAGE